jgi:SAM-dependent methyltransferase
MTRVVAWHYKFRTADFLQAAKLLINCRQPDMITTMEMFDRFARFYDDDYRRYDADLATLADLAEEQGDPILELGCGTGRVLVALAAAGYTITGIDISPALLAVAEAKLRNTPYTIGASLVKADLRTFDLPCKEFAFAFCTSNTLMHLTTQADQLQALHNSYAHLRTDGLLLLDLFNPDVTRLNAVNGLMELADQWSDPATDAQVLKWCVRTVDWAAQLQETLFVYEESFPDGRTQRTLCPFTLRFLWQGEAELLLQMAGFAIEAVWGDFDGAPYTTLSEHLILLARK